MNFSKSELKKLSVKQLANVFIPLVLFVQSKLDVFFKEKASLHICV